MADMAERNSCGYSVFPEPVHNNIGPQLTSEQKQANAIGDVEANRRLAGIEPACPFVQLREQTENPVAACGRCIRETRSMLSLEISSTEEWRRALRKIGMNEKKADTVQYNTDKPSATTKTMSALVGSVLKEFDGLSDIIIASALCGCYEEHDRLIPFEPHQDPDHVRNGYALV